MIQNLDLEIENKLNPGQKEAVKAIYGPVLVIAGPGTGKTQVLSYRIANILHKTDVMPSNILCLTFTETGALQMQNRLFKLIGKDAFYVKIQTFHSFCNEVIKSNANIFAFSKNLNQLDDLSGIKIFRHIIDSLIKEKGKDFSLYTFADNYFYFNDIKRQIQNLKREGILPNEFLELSTKKLEMLNQNPKINKKTGKPTTQFLKDLEISKKNVDLAIIYNRYQESLKEEGFYDYEDMLLSVIENLTENTNLLLDIQEQYQFILVDEYQDTNGAQNKLLKLLTSYDASPNIFAVGDDDQAIFRFQGANVENLLFFEKQFSDVKIITLNQNYRSSQIILDASSSLIENNTNRLSKMLPNINKNLKAGLEIPNKKIEVVQFNNQSQEIDFIIKEIQNLISNNVLPSDIAIFYKEHKDAINLSTDLIGNNIEINLEAGTNLLNQKPISQLIELLKVIEFNVNDNNFLLFKVINFPFFKISKLDCFKLSRISYLKKIDLFTLISSKNYLIENKIESVESIIDFSNKIIEWANNKHNYSFLNFIKKVMDESKFLDYYFTNGSVQEINSIQSFFEYLKLQNSIKVDLNLTQFLQDLNLIEENKLLIKEQEVSVNKQGVNLMTAHKSKGLEFKYVFIISCIDGKWGNKSKRDKLKLIPEVFSRFNNIENLTEDNLEEERRLFFVALTRAKEKIFITYSNNYISEGGSTKESLASIFIKDIDTKFVDFKEVTENYLNKAISINKLKFIDESHYSVKEIEYLKSIIENLSVSATSLNKFIECPIKYKFEDLLKIPQPYDQSAGMGSAIHFALEKFFREKIAGHNKTLDFIIEKYKYSLNLQFLNQNEFNSTLQEGIDILTNYYNHYNLTFSTPADVEYNFSGKKLYLELDDNQDPIIITGKIDKIEWINKEKGLVRVVDYKTSNYISSNEILGLNKNSNKNILRQLTFYKLLGDLDYNFINLDSRLKYRIEECQIDFLKPKKNTNKFTKETVVITNEHINELKATISSVVKKIRNLEFNSLEYPACGNCKYCNLVKNT